MPALRRDTSLADSLLSPSPRFSLPPLFPTPTKDLAALHAKLYNLVALILRAYVQQWYSRISPRDQALLPAINTLLAETLPPLLSPDPAHLTNLILTDLPVILTTHIRTYWESRGAVIVSPGPLDQAYHVRLPLISVSLQRDSIPVAVPAALAEALSEPLSAKPEQEEETYALSPVYLTALADSLLSLHLPPADYASDAERLIVREVLARAVLASIGRRLSAPWFWAQLGIKLLPERQPKQPRSVFKAVKKLYSAGIALLLFLYASAKFIIEELRSTQTPSRKRVLDPWLALLHALVEPTIFPTPIWLSLVLLFLDSTALVLSPFFDRLLPHLLDHLLTPKMGIKVLDLAERVLFPNGWPQPSIDPTPEEAEELDTLFRQRLRERGAPDYLIDPISDPGCNAHLVGMIYNAVVAAVVPDLASSV